MPQPPLTSCPPEGPPPSPHTYGGQGTVLPCSPGWVGEENELVKWDQQEKRVSALFLDPLSFSAPRFGPAAFFQVLTKQRLTLLGAVMVKNTYASVLLYLKWGNAYPGCLTVMKTSGLCERLL